MYRNKLAALGGTGSDKSFEEAVSNLAHEFLSDKAPTLMKSELGFQMLDKSDDDNKGVGVCVFKPNDTLMFVPIFFLNGEIKGHELLYLPDQDLFVPLKEPWVNELLGKKPAQIGDPVDKNFQRQNGSLQPNLSLFRTPPKIASYINPGILREEPNFVPKLQKFIATTGLDFAKTAQLMQDSYKTVRKSIDLSRFFKYASTRAIKKLNDMVNSSVLTKKAFATMYPKVSLEKIASSRDIRVRDRNFLNIDPDPNWRDTLFTPEKKAGYVSIISYTATITNGGNEFDLSEAEKEKLAKQQYLVVDTRKDGEISHVVKGPQQLTTPTDTGVYSALMADGSFEDIVVIRRVGFKDEFHPERDNDYVIFRYSDTDGKNGLERTSKHIFTAKKYPKEKFESWWKKLPSCTNYNFVKDNYDLNFIDDRGICYGPVNGFVSRKEEVIRIENDKGEAEIGGRWSRNIKKRGDRLYVPADCKVFSSSYTSFPAENNILFGEPELLRYSEGKDLQTVKLSTAHDWCTINNKRYPTKYAGFCALIKDYNLREKDAKALFKQAEANVANYHTASIYIKRAADIINPEVNRRPGSDMYFPEVVEGNNPVFGDLVPTAPNSTQTVTTGEEFLAPNTGPYERSLNNPYPADEMLQVQQALQSGQDEVFNLSTLKQFLNDGDISAEIDEEVPELIRGMNHAGRMLFRYYWKGEQFKELYGPQEMPELESSLKKIFELTGDVVLLLKHKLKKDDTYGELSKLNLASVDG